MKKNQVKRLSQSALLLFTAILVPALGYAIPVTVDIASNSAIKKNAVKSAFHTVLPNHEYSASPFAAESEIADQPVGEEAGIQGAMKRLRNTQTHFGLETAPDFWVSVENYIEEPTNGSKDWSDRAVVILQRGSEKPVIEFSKRVYFDAKYAEEAKRQTPSDYQFSSTGYSVTCGKLIQADFASRGITIADNDFHVHPQFGGISRTFLIEETIIEAFKTLIKREITAVPNFKGNGAIFHDMDPLLAVPVLTSVAINLMVNHTKGLNIAGVGGIETRGYILGATIAVQLGVPFYRVAKKGKLPNPTFVSDTFETEYSTAALEIDVSDLGGKNILLVDDLMATGHTFETAEKLFKLANGNPISTSLIELTEMSGITKLSAPESFFSLIKL